jgi:hypothetical protein
MNITLWLTSVESPPPPAARVQASTLALKLDQKGPYC